jgi:hypothetical protein
MLGESFTASDIATKSISKKIHDFVSQSDEISKTINKVLKEPKQGNKLYVSDARPVIEINKALKDILSLNSRARVSGIHMISLQEVFILNDEVRKRIGIRVEDVMAAPDEDSRRRVLKRLAEDLALDESEITKEINKFIREISTHFRDNLGVLKEIDFHLAESLELSDEVRRQLDWFRSLEELLEIEDRVRKSFNKFLAEDLTLDSLLEIQWQVQRSLGSALSITDVILTQVEFNRYLAELAETDDSVKKSFGKIMIETLNLQETFKNRVRFFRLLGDELLSPEDSVLKSVGKRAGDSVQVTEDSFVFGVDKVLGEVASMVDPPVTKEFFKQLVEEFLASENLRKTIGKVLDDSVSLEDFTEQVTPFLIELGEQFTTIDRAEARRIAFAITFALILLDSRTRFEIIDRGARDQLPLDDKFRTELQDDEFGA